MPQTPFIASRPRARRRFVAVAAAAAVALTSWITAPAALAASAPAVVNGEFSQTTAAGFPSGWGFWNPAGSAAVAVTAGAAPAAFRRRS